MEQKREIEKVRERKGKRERVKDRERSTQFGEEASMDHSIGEGLG